ncbi:MAG: hypothetical protein HFJ91_02395 [Muribaculaceae bacterium]|nr:hypothetical protein [Muribaculaceae bacterium]
MKRYLPVLTAALLGVAMCSCDENARLAKEISGEWVGTPENFTDNSALTASIIDTYLFSPDTCTTSKCHAGPLVIDGMISTTTQIVGDSSFIEPISLTASARSSIKGSWRVVDDDEILITLDPATITIDVDPSAIALNSTMVAGGKSPAIDSLRPAVAANIGQSLRQALPIHYAGIRHLDDIKIKGALLKYEINDVDYVLTRQ